MSMKPNQSTTLFICFSLLFLLPGCLRQLDFEGESPDLLSINGLIFQDQALHLSVSNTTSITNPRDSIRFLPHATVKVWEDEIYMGTMKLDSFPSGDPKNQFIMPNLFPQPNSNYRIETSVSGFENAVAETTVPSMPKISAIRFIGGEPISPDSRDYYAPWSIYRNTFEVDIEDEAGVENFYLLGSVMLKSIDNGIPQSLNYGQIDYPNTSLLEGEEFIIDETFANGIGTIRFSVDSHRWIDEAKFFIRLTNAPMEYVRRRREQKNVPASNNPLAEPFSQFSNVVGGVGVLTCFPSVYDSTTIFQ